MRVLVVNCSYEPKRWVAGSISGYNLGAAKLADWLRAQGHEVAEWQGNPGMFALGYDLVCLSVIFSWHAPVAREIALRVKSHVDVWCGGPGMFALAKWWQVETGLPLHVGIDSRFDRQPGTYLATFASRECPVGCWFCLVPRFEGKAFTLHHDFVPASILMDNNLSALPVEFQAHVISRYKETETPLLDANSGFEPRAFTEETYHRWRRILRGPWRFAFDELREEEDVRRMMRILSEVSPRRKRVYVLIGNEPVEACYYRAERVIEWEGEPYCQPVIKPERATPRGFASAIRLDAPESQGFRQVL